MTGTRLTQSQLQAALVANGATADVAKILAACGMCEAPYSANGVSYSDCTMIGDQALANAEWGYSYGFFQIRSKRAEKGKGTWRDETRLGDADFNCRAAIAIQKAQGFGAWSTYTNGTYKAYLPKEFPPPAGTYVVVGGDSLTGITAKLGKLWDWQALAAINNLARPWTIFINQKLQLPWIDYTVASGDTLTAIVNNYTSGVSVTDAAAFNKLTNPNLISVGQVLHLPRAAYLEYLEEK